MAKTTPKDKSPSPIVNRKARHDYEILETLEAGIALVGSEVKSVWGSRVNMVDAYCRVVGGELWLMNLDIEPYSHASVYLPDRRRDRKLLVHKRQIIDLERKVDAKGYTLVPLRIYFKNGKVKVEIGIARGRRQYDKRHQLQQEETRREMQAVKQRRAID
ncbi:MAG: SsrA-binding protein SmpB [Fimbriimonadaceae bacterium]